MLNVLYPDRSSKDTLNSVVESFTGAKILHRTGSGSRKKRQEIDTRKAAFQAYSNIVNNDNLDSEGGPVTDWRRGRNNNTKNLNSDQFIGSHSDARSISPGKSVDRPDSIDNRSAKPQMRRSIMASNSNNQTLQSLGSQATSIDANKRARSIN